MRRINLGRFFGPCFAVSLLGVSLAAPAAWSGSAIRDVSPDAEKTLSLACPAETQLFGAVPPQGFEAWCAKPPSKPGERPIFHGPRVLWYANGQKLASGEYRDGKQIGVATAWHENGEKRIEEHFDKGLRHGLSTAWYANGTKQGEGRFEHGKEEGLWTWWHENGKKAASGEFRAGQRFGVWTHWNPDGSFKATEGYPPSAGSKPTPTK